VTACSVSPEVFTARADLPVYVHPGRLYVGQGEERVTTILGSCVAVCLHDPIAGIGGLNHFLLPHSPIERESSPRYAGAAVEWLVELMLTEGARASRLQARVIGGARVLSAFADDPHHLGLRNADAAHALLAARRIPVVSSDIGGDRGRKLLFVPRDGSHHVQLLGR
jgi:chemotaxis protein CheD